MRGRYVMSSRTPPEHNRQSRFARDGITTFALAMALLQLIPIGSCVALLSTML